MNAAEPNPPDHPVADAAGTPTPAPGEGTEGQAPKRRRAPRRKPAAEAAMEPAGSSTDAVPKPAVQAATAGPANDDDPAQPAHADAVEAVPGAAAGRPQAGAGEATKRNRNRRRGRRGRARDGQDSPPPAEEQRLHLPQPEVGEVFAQVLSGEFDVEIPAPVAEAADAPAPKRVLAPEPDAPKLQKVLAQSGIGSRRDIEQFIADGRITVNGQPAHVGQRISFGDQVRIDGRAVKVRITPPAPRVLAYHKPVGEVVSHDDPQQRPTVFRRLPRLAHGKWQSVGRLDINTEGLLLFTNSGELANQLMHPRFGVEREYAVRVLGALDDAARERLLAGVEVDGQSAAFKSLEDGGGEGANRWYRVVITEGRHREVRKLFEAVGHAVSRLIRVRYGPVVLPRGLRRGVWVDLDDAEVRTLRHIARPQRAPVPDDAAADGERRGRRGARRGRKPEGGLPRGESTGAGRFEPEHADVDEVIDGRAIPNPLQQTYDKRALHQARTQRREIDEDGPIPNPLQQTYDKRALQQARTPKREYGEDGPIPNPLQQTYDKRFVQGGPRQGGGAAAGGKRRSGGGGSGGGGGAQRQPDPMKTAVGYIGADAFLRKAAGQGRGGRGKPGRRSR